MEPLPSVNRAYSLILRVEKQREINVNYGEAVKSSALLARTQIGYSTQKRNIYNKPGQRRGDMNKRDKENQFCEHCNVKGHLKETCFKLHGYPDWYKAQRESQRKFKTMANMIETPLIASSEMTADGKPDIKVDWSNLIQQEISKFMKGKT